MFIDTHAHLFYENYNEDRELVIHRAATEGVHAILVPATDLKTSEFVYELVKKHDFIYGAVGVHPHETKNWNKSILPKIEALSRHERIVAIGEIGLDYHYDFSPREKQIEAFRDQIELALKLDLPIIVHNRESDKDMMDIIRSYCGSGLKAQFHCFNGSLEDAHELINMNHYISFTGNITFNNADSLREIIANVTLDNLLLETDSPFMAPIPYRGKRNEPAYVKHIAEKISEIHQLPVEEIARITSFNTFKLFGIGKIKDTSFTYQIGESLYVNITNRCNADCVFCQRKKDTLIQGYNLRMSKSEEPPAQVYIDEIGDPLRYKEIVFCGYGEPTIRWDVVKQVARYVKECGGVTRLNTNGHGNYINKRDITPELKGLIDIVSISLNTADPRQYAELMRLETRMFNEMINFARNSKKYVERVAMSVVSLDSVNVERARQVVEEKIGAEFRVRQYF